MSHYAPSTAYSTSNSGVCQYVPNYVIRSDYLPSNQVSTVCDSQTSQLLHQYEQEKRRGHVYTQRPVEFNPARYRSVRVSENVLVNQPITEQQFSRVCRR